MSLRNHGYIQPCTEPGMICCWNFVPVLFSSPRVSGLHEHEYELIVDSWVFSRRLESNREKLRISDVILCVPPRGQCIRQFSLCFSQTITMNTSKDPPTTSNPRGRVVSVVVLVSTAFVLVFVILRLWGRYRYRSGLGASARAKFGDNHLWVFLSDTMILISLVSYDHH